MRDPKTPAQLRREIAYFAGRMKRTTSRNRIHRCHTAIQKRERQLEEALKVGTTNVKARRE